MYHHNQNGYRRHQNVQTFHCSSRNAMSFLAGMISMLAILSLLLRHPKITALTTIPDTSATTSTMDNDMLLSIRPTNIPQSNNLTATMLHVLLLDVHLEGNLGDEMETMPLLKYLKDSKISIMNDGTFVNVHVTAILSGWLENHEQQLNFRSIREHSYIDKILTWQNDDIIGINGQQQPQRQYHDLDFDVIILAPGPWKLCNLHNNLWKNQHKIDVLFGGSIMEEKNEQISSDLHYTCKLDHVIKELHPDMITVRETKSLEKLQSFQSSIDQTIISLSGDLTHSFQLVQSTFEFWKQHYYGNMNSLYHNTTLIFTRANNARNVVFIKGRKVILTVLDGISDTYKNVTLPSHNVIFATSSAIEDSNMFLDWKHQYYNRLKAQQFVICDTIEQLFGLVSKTQHVYTDRYHPGVVASVLGVDFSILQYEQEQNKLIGLYNLVYKEKISANTIRNEHNAKAFAKLGQLLKRKAVAKMRKG